MGNDDTGRRVKRAQTQTERDMEGLAALRERQARGQAIALEAVPAPFEGVDTGITERIQDDPDLTRIYAKVAKSTAANDRKIAMQRQEMANLVLEVAGERPPAERFAGLEKRIKFAHWVTTALVIPVIAAIVLSVKYIYARGVADTRIEIEHAQLVQNIADLKAANADLVKRLDATEETARQNATRIDDLFRERPTSRKLDTTRTPQRAATPQAPRETP